MLYVCTTYIAALQNVVGNGGSNSDCIPLKQLMSQVLRQGLVYHRVYYGYIILTSVWFCDWFIKEYSSLCRISTTELTAQIKYY